MMEVQAIKTKRSDIHGKELSTYEKDVYDIRPACKFEIQIWEQALLVARILCEYGRVE